LNTDDETKLEYALRGKAWRVYWFLLKTGQPVSVREVQRALHFSSPSVANHHLEQLRELGLVQKQEIGGQYVLVGEVKIGVLRHYVKLGKLLFPRYFLCPFLNRFLCSLPAVSGSGFFYTGKPFYCRVRCHHVRYFLVRGLPRVDYASVLKTGTTCSIA
jgi:DNA-binding transcriptional ArsR family regulator